MNSFTKFEIGARYHINESSCIVYEVLKRTAKRVTLQRIEKPNSPYEHKGDVITKAITEWAQGETVIFSNGLQIWTWENKITA
ncbi:MAG: hypothetical protein NC120_09275 [Ruminococcus sp.]|nr:hypothetical protein [Ruminococcus sp.]